MNQFIKLINQLNLSKDLSIKNLKLAIVKNNQINNMIYDIDSTKR